MNKKELEQLIMLRTDLIKVFDRLRDYKSNENAIMKEHDHARVLHNTITRIDQILGDHVTFQKG